MIPVRILGIDPGLRRTGWGLVTIEGTRLAYVACGTVASDASAPLAHRLKQLHDGIAAVVFAQLITKGINHGVHAFYVPIRDADVHVATMSCCMAQYGLPNMATSLCLEELRASLESWWSCAIPDPVSDPVTHVG